MQQYNNPRIRRKRRMVLAKAVLAVAWLIYPGGGRAGEMAETESRDFMGRGIVEATVLSVRARPGTNYEVVSRLRRGATVQIVSELGGEWYEIIAPEDTMAWCAKHFIDPSGAVNADNVHVRAGPGLVFSPFAVLEQGQTVQTIDRPRNGWQRIQAPPDATVWVYSQYIALKSAVGEDPGVATADPQAEPQPDPETETAIDEQTKPTPPEPEPAAETQIEPPPELEPKADAVPQADSPEESVEESAVEPPPELEPKAEVEPDLELIPRFDPETEPLTVGRVVSLGDRRTARASHFLVAVEGADHLPKCYLISESVNLRQWESRTVRVYGDKHWHPGWRLPVIRVSGIQLLRTVGRRETNDREE